MSDGKLGGQPDLALAFGNLDIAITELTIMIRKLAVAQLRAMNGDSYGSFTELQELESNIELVKRHMEDARAWAGGEPRAG
ncbi:MAG: hypothetical protein K2X76_04680 [Sphingomonas sp.]|nr:hypothetical protein [Sphingomonas sp.]